MFTTDGADAVVLRRARRDRRRAADRVRARRRADARAADGDDRPGDVPRPRRGARRDRAGARARRSTCCRRSASGGRRPSRRRARSSRATGGSTAALPELRWPPGYGPRRRPTRGLFAPLTGIAARRPLRERGDQPPRRPRGRAAATSRPCSSPATAPGSTQGRRSRTSCDVAGLRHHRDDLAASCSCSARDPAAMARAAARVAELGGGFAFDGGWSAPLEIDGLIAAGGFDTSRCDRA